LQSQFELCTYFHPTAAILAAASIISPVPAMAVSQSVFCYSAADSAVPVCERFAEIVTASGWLEKRPGVTIAVEVLTNSATQLRIALTVAAPDGRSTRIDRALSVIDTTMTPAMQDSFLQKLLLALPSDF
jgi:hypothetical protein